MLDECIFGDVWPHWINMPYKILLWRNVFNFIKWPKILHYIKTFYSFYSILICLDNIRHQMVFVYSYVHNLILQTCYCKSIHHLCMFLHSDIRSFVRMLNSGWWINQKWIKMKCDPNLRKQKIYKYLLCSKGIDDWCYLSLLLLDFYLAPKLVTWTTMTWI